MKRTVSRNSAVTNTVVLAFDLIMLFASAPLYLSGAVGFDGVLIPTVALFSSFGPVIALAALGSTLQNTFAAGNRVLDILDETRWWWRYPASRRSPLPAHRRSR